MAQKFLDYRILMSPTISPFYIHWIHVPCSKILYSRISSIKGVLKRCTTFSRRFGWLAQQNLQHPLPHLSDSAVGGRCSDSLGWCVRAFYVGWLDGLLGVAGMMKLIVSQWIIPEHSLRFAPVSCGLVKPALKPSRRLAESPEKKPTLLAIPKSSPFVFWCEQKHIPSHASCLW